MKPWVLLVVCATWMLALAPAAPGEVIRDDFESYGLGSGLSGGAGGEGWSVAWSASGGTIVAGMPDGTQAARVVDKTDTAMTRDFAALTDTVYVGLLLRTEALTSSQFIQIQIGDGDTGYGDKNVGFGIRNTGNNPFFARIGRNTTNSSTTFSANDTTCRLVGRLTKGVSGNYEQVTLWVDPADESDTPAAVHTQNNFTAGIGQLTRFNVRAYNFDGSQVLWLDDLRIAGSFAEAIPEPATLALLLAGAAGALLRRRRT
jgi:hypothetical protein